MEELGQQTVDFSKLVKQAVEESYLQLSELVSKGRSAGDGKADDRSDSEKKIDLLKFVNRTRQRMLRLNVVAKWCQQVPLTQRAQQLQSTLSCHDTCFTQAADNLFFMHDGLQQARAPIYDVPSAVEILLTGNYQRFPKCIEDIGAGGALSETLQKPALRKLDSLVRSKFLEISVPKEFSEVNIKNGTVLLKVSGEFKALVTLGYRGHLSMWRILHLDLLVGQKSGPIKLEKTRRLVLGDDLERRMSVASNPFFVLYSVLHELCVALVMDTVIRQVQCLRLGRWKDAIRFDLISDGGNVSTLLNQDGDADSAGIKTPGVKILYWLDLEKNSDPNSAPSLKIEPGPDLQICCTHSTFLIDPLKGQGAVFSLDQSCIDIEMLLLRAIFCHRYTRLFEIHKDLENNRNVGDVILHKFFDASIDEINKIENEPCQSESGAPEVLHVRAYGSSYFTLGINIRNGRFLLRMSNNILPHAILSECEEALNQGTTSAAEVFSNLRSRSILQLFASIGMFLGLQVYEDTFAASKVPKFLHNGSPMLLMGFPDCGSSYFLLLQLDMDFKLLFKMLESHSPDSEKPLSEFDRFIKVDINQVQLPENDLNLSASHLLPEIRNGLLEHEILPETCFDASIQSPSSHSNFSSVVEDVFQLEKSSSPQMNPSEKRQKLYQTQSSSLSPFNPGPRRITSSKSDQNLAALSSPSLVQIDSFRSVNDDHLAAMRSPAQNLGALAVSSNSISLPSTPQSHQIGESDSQNLSAVGPPATRISRKRKLSVIVNLIPTLKGVATKTELDDFSSTTIGGGYNYGTLISEANKGNMASSVYVSALLSVVRHCSLCIKYARLTTQMDALEIPYVEEVGFRSASSNIWFRLPFARFDSSHHMCLRLGKPGTMQWDVKITDQHFRDLWELQKCTGSSTWGSGIRIANTSDVDSHIRFDPDGVVLSYHSVEDDSVKKLVADIRRLCYARMFAQGMRLLLGVRNEEKIDEFKGNEANDKQLEQLRRTFKIEAVGLMSFWFSFGSGVIARFVVEWECGRDGCTMHVLPDQLWPHTKFLEEFVNGGEVVPLLDCIRLTAGPLHALAAATRPARAGPTPAVAAKPVTGNPGFTSGMLGPNRNGPGIVPNSLLPIDVSVVLRGPYWVRIIYRKNFAVDMRCFAGDQVWLQPATPPKGGPSVGGSLPCPQFRPFIMEHVAQELNGLDPSFSIANSGISLGPQMGPSPTRPVFPALPGLPNRPSPTQMPVMSRVGNGLSVRRPPGANAPTHVRGGDLNTAIIGLGDDGGYGGGWVPLVALKKVLRGILKYLGVLWMFAQLPELLKEILGSILKETEGSLLNLDQEQPALRFFVGGYVFAVSVHRVQLLLQVLSVRRFHSQPQHQQSQPQQQQQPPQAEDLTQTEIGEICDFFSRRVASEPFDACRVASFITLLTLPIPVLREFLKLIAWKKGTVTQGGEVTPGQKPRIELCLENHLFEKSDAGRVAKSNVVYDRAHSAVDFSLTLILDPAHIPHVNSAGGAGWLPYCVSARLRYTFGADSSSASVLSMDGSHGGRACWTRVEDWEKCKQVVARTVEVGGSSTTVDLAVGRLKTIADNVQRTLNMCLQGLRDGDAL